MLAFVPFALAFAASGPTPCPECAICKETECPTPPACPSPPASPMLFERISTFLVCTAIEPTCNDDTETVAEIVVASDDGKMLIYSNSERKTIGLVDISDPKQPVSAGEVDVGGEATSVAVANGLILAGVNTSPDYISPSGKLVVIDMATKAILASHELGGQPDAVAVSPDKTYVVVAIENERDEDLGEGVLPQMPAGFIVVIKTEHLHAGRRLDHSEAITKVDFTSLEGCHSSEDPEPEFVAISKKNIAVVTMQENNCIALVDLASATIQRSFTAGTVDLEAIDTVEEDVVSLVSKLAAVPREPDGVTWIGTEFFATADEGDMNGGSRGFTIFNLQGEVVYTSGNMLEHMAVKVGHYPEQRSGNKGSEPENVFYGEYEHGNYLFVNLERASIVAVFEVSNPHKPVYMQVLPATVGPEGGAAIPSRGLAVVAGEKDSRADKMRSSISIYGLKATDVPSYPTIISSAKRFDGSPVPFSALSGLVCHGDRQLISVEDSFYKKSRFLLINAHKKPAKMHGEVRLVDAKGVLAGLQPQGQFDAADLARLINPDKTVNIDPEGVAIYGSQVIIASEGSGTVNDTSRPVKSLNMLLVVDGITGVIDEVVTLPAAVNEKQLRFGFEGVAVDGNHAVVAVQRAWGDDSNPMLIVYNLATKTWEKMLYYPLDEPESQNGGWVGLSDIAPLGGFRFRVLERDNQGGPDAAIKRVYNVDLSGVANGATVSKVLHRDLMPLYSASSGLAPEKVEGLAVCPDGTEFVVNDNDGVDDNSGEMQLLMI